MDRNFSELDLQLVMFDLSEIEEERDDNVVAGVAIRASDAEAFAADVERLAVEDFRQQQNEQNAMFILNKSLACPYPYFSAFPNINALSIRRLEPLNSTRRPW